MDKESIIYDTATISDIPEFVRLRILYMIDDFGPLTNEELMKVKGEKLS